MPRTKAATTPSVAPKTRRAPAMTERKRTPKAKAVTAVEPEVAVIEFEPSAHYDEIAQVAYLKWLGRSGAPGSPEEDWLAAELEVRAKYAA